MDWNLTFARQQYDCEGCGRCCRRFFVPMTVDEQKRIAGLTARNDFYENRADGCFFRRDAGTGACVFQLENNLCAVHKDYGFSAKALVCRGYPFVLMPTFPGEISILARMDCPAALKNKGRALTAHTTEIKHLLQELNPSGGITEGQLKGLTKETVKSLLGQMLEILQREKHLAFSQKMLLLMTLAIEAEKLGAAFLNDKETMREVYPSLRTSLLQREETRPTAPLTKAETTVFLRWATPFVRRDEEILRPTLSARLQNAWRLFCFVIGHGNLRSISNEHPDFPLKKWHKLPDGPTFPWESYQRFLENRLETLQFFSAAYYGADLFQGLKALLLTYSLATFLAQIHAAALQHEEIHTEDCDYAVMSLDHALGRSPALAAPRLRKLETQLATRFPALLQVYAPQPKNGSGQ